MPKLSFSLAGFKSWEFQSLDLPVEVRKLSMALVARTLTTQQIDVSPGMYFISATLPAGQQLTSHVEVKETDVQVSLTPQPDEESPHESHEKHHFLSAPFGLSKTSSLLRSDSYQPTTVRPRQVPIAMVTGTDPMAVTRDQSISLGQIRELDDTVQFDYWDSSGPPVGSQRYLEILQPDLTAMRVALPARGDKSCLLVVKAVSPTATGVDVHLQNTEADFLMRSLNRGGNVGSLLDSTRLAPGNLLQENAEEMVRKKMADPLSACVGAYALLQYGEIERLRDWTENLKNWFPWLPDGLAIRGEHLARLGKHEEAIQNLSDLGGRGTPFFRDGLSYAVERLRMYLRSKTSRFREETVSRARETYNKLQAVIARTDLSAPVLTVKGLPPSPEIGEQSRIVLTIRLAPSVPDVEVETDAAAEAGAGAA